MLLRAVTISICATTVTATSPPSRQAPSSEMPTKESNNDNPRHQGVVARGLAGGAGRQLFRLHPAREQLPRRPFRVDGEGSQGIARTNKGTFQAERRRTGAAGSDPERTGT